MLTAALVETGARVLAVELDPELGRTIDGRFEDVELVIGDFLAFELPEGARIVANLPFGITARAIRHIKQSRAHDAHLILQREAAAKFAGRPWGPETLASLELKPWWHVEILQPLRRTDFEPPPSVDCAYLWLARRRPALLPEGDTAYQAFLRRTFGRGRTLGEVLRRSFTRTQLAHLRQELQLPLDGPPSTASFEQWLALYRAFVRLRAEQRPR
jgi:16S rRNA A1518/A1519 N6-dimethyltransferase RsmA/KsgA/DIM1 with predicted DNA glycosylase/AP lyase activity